VRGLGAALRGLPVAAGDLVGQQHLQEIVVRQPIRSCISALRSADTSIGLIAGAASGRAGLMMASAP
jgi:hypothetical protein